MTTENKKHFTDEQVVVIGTALEQLCPNEAKCVQRAHVFESVKEHMGEMDVTEFNFALSAAIRADIFVGFQTRAGRSGGVHRAGVFDSAAQKPKVKVSKTNTVVTLNDTNFVVGAKSTHLQKYIVDVLNGQETDTGAVVVGKKRYNCDTVALEKYLGVLVAESVTSSTASPTVVEV